MSITSKAFSCVSCDEPYTDVGAHEIQMLDCGHDFCKSCVEQILGHRVTCPSCQYQMPAMDVEQTGQHQANEKEKGEKVPTPKDSESEEDDTSSSTASSSNIERNVEDSEEEMDDDSDQEDDLIIMSRVWEQQFGPRVDLPPSIKKL